MDGQDEDGDRANSDGLREGTFPGKTTNSGVRSVGQASSAPPPLPLPVALLPHAPTVQVTHQIKLLNPPQQAPSEAVDSVTDGHLQREETSNDTLNQASIIESMSGHSTTATVTSEANNSTVPAQIEIPSEMKPIIPNEGTVIDSENLTFIFCKPKLLPIKSITIEKLEQLQRTANERAKKQEQDELKEQSIH